MFVGRPPHLMEPDEPPRPPLLASRVVGARVFVASGERERERESRSCIESPSQRALRRVVYRFDEAGVGAYLASILEVSDSEDLDSGRDIVARDGAHDRMGLFLTFPSGISGCFPVSDLDVSHSFKRVL